MELNGIPQPLINWDSSNLVDTWKKFQQHVDLIFEGPLADKDDKVKITYLLLWIGDKGRDIYNTWKLSEDDKKSLKSHYDKFLAYVQPKTNSLLSRCKFRHEIQGMNESVEQFITRLKLIARDCNFKNNTTDEMIRDSLIFGTNSHKVKEKLINEGDDLTLEKAIQIAQTFEYSQVQLKEMRNIEPNPSTTAVHAVKSRPHHRPTDVPSQKHNSNTKKDNQRAVRNRQWQTTSDNREKCGNCGYSHSKREDCPAKGKKCNSCHKWNHFAKMCRLRRKVHSIQAESVENTNNTDEDTDFFIDCINISKPSCNNDQAFATLNICSKPVIFKLDTGSQVNILPKCVLDTLNFRGSLQVAPRSLSTYDSKPLPSLGVCHLPCKHNSLTGNIEFYCVNTNNPPILGMKSCLDYELIKLVYSCNVSNTECESAPVSSKSVEPICMNKKTVLTEYSDIFDGVGLLPGEIDIHVDPKVTPVIHPPRRIPVSLGSRLKSELDRMEKNDIICKVEVPTPWVNSLVLVEKPNGKLRVCLDPKDLNNAIQRPHYPMKTLEDILPQLSNASFFSKLDVTSGYWALCLTEKSSFLTTFNTPYGRYRNLRLPFGLNCSQDLFQSKIDECYSGLEGATAIVDDILIYGSTREEHDRNLRKVLETSRKKGIKLNRDKLEVGVTEVTYFGHVLTSEGVKADPNKVKAISDMPPPTNKSELQTVLGMINYMSKFAPNLAEITSPMRSLLNKDVEFSWDKPQSEAFQKVKDILTRSPGPVLAYYDPKKELTLQVDASKYGLGAVLFQDSKPITVASKSLTTSEVNYAQIEKEMYAILFGCKRFHQYIYGRPVKVETDHKPLVSIMKKSLLDAPARLQRMILQLQRYDLEIVHLPGKCIPVADTLSRKFLSDTYPDFSESFEAQVHMVTSNLPVSDRKMLEIEKASLTDPQFRILRSTILKGWPNMHQECPAEILDYWNHRDELTVLDGLIFKGNKIVIPLVLRPQMLDKIHAGHMGVEKCIHRARDVLFWPKMAREITNMVLNCTVCLEHRNANCKEPMEPHDIPKYPWQVVATDLFHFDNNDYVVVVDYYSTYFDVFKLNSTKSVHVINKLKGTFSRFGIPETVVSDNGPQFSCQEFTDFSKKWDFKHITSSPHYPKSNGLAEKTVQIVKRIKKKCKVDSSDPNLALLEYHTTPLNSGFSPSQLLMSRKLRSILPSTVEEFLPRSPNYDVVQDKLCTKQVYQKKYYDVGSKSLKLLETGDSVRIRQGDGLWKPAVVSSKYPAKRSYVVETPNGGIYRRNRRDLIKTNDKVSIPVDDFQVQVGNNVSPELNVETKFAVDTDNTEQVQSDVKSNFVTPQTDNKPYITRSGRVVKPKIIQSM